MKFEDLNPQKAFITLGDHEYEMRAFDLTADNSTLTLH